MDYDLINQRIASFKGRAENIGLREGVEYTMEPLDGPADYRIKVIHDDGHNKVRTFYTLMGLATHFQDRSWATARSWCFIVKSEFSLRFTDLPTDQALNE